MHQMDDVYLALDWASNADAVVVDRLQDSDKLDDILVGLAQALVVCWAQHQPLAYPMGYDADGPVKLWKCHGKLEKLDRFHQEWLKFWHFFKEKLNISEFATVFDR